MGSDFPTLPRFSVHAAHFSQAHYHYLFHHSRRVIPAAAACTYHAYPTPPATPSILRAPAVIPQINQNLPSLPSPDRIFVLPPFTTCPSTVPPALFTPVLHSGVISPDKSATFFHGWFTSSVVTHGDRVGLPHNRTSLSPMPAHRTPVLRYWP